MTPGFGRQDLAESFFRCGVEMNLGDGSYDLVACVMVIGANEKSDQDESS